MLGIRPVSEYLTMNLYSFLRKNRVLLTDTPGLPPIVATEFDYGDARWENKKLTKV